MALLIVPAARAECLSHECFCKRAYPSIRPALALTLTHHTQTDVPSEQPQL